MSFLHTLKLPRLLRHDLVVDAASHAQARWLRDAQPERHAGRDIDQFLSGTEAAFEQFLDILGTMTDGSYVQGHFAYDAEIHARALAADVVIVFLYRDPRASLASMAHFLVDRGEPAQLVPYLSQPDIPTALRLLLEGNDGIVPFEDVFAPYEGWRDAEGVISLRFEDIVGPRGNGSLVRQVVTLTALAESVGWQGSAWDLLDAIDLAFYPGAGTFRRGTIDGWREDLRDLAASDHWAPLERLARRWGYAVNGAPMEPPPLCSADTALASLIQRLQSEHRAEMDARSTLEHERLEYLATIAQLRARIAGLKARRSMRIVDRLGGIASSLTRLGSQRSPRG
jgi:hypothetical protein